MTPFFVFLLIPQKNPGRNFAFSEIHRENMVSMLIPHKNVIHTQRHGASEDLVAFVNSSQLPELATIAKGKTFIYEQRRGAK